MVISVSAQYTGQIRCSLASRHRGHCSEIKSARDGLGAHFNKHGQELGLDLRNSKDLDQLMSYFSIIIIASIDSSQKSACQDLDRLEQKFHNKLINNRTFFS